MEDRSPAQVYALVIGVTLVAAGILGFFYSASFSTGDGAEREALLGILDVNAWHNLVHIASGAVGLLRRRRPIEAPGGTRSASVPSIWSWRCSASSRATAGRSSI